MSMYCMYCNREILPGQESREYPFNDGDRGIRIGRIHEICPPDPAKKAAIAFAKKQIGFEEFGRIMAEVVVIEIPLVNDDGYEYGTRYTIFAERPAQIDDWIAKNVDDSDGEPWYNNRRIWQQTTIDRITVYDEGGNLSREPWWDLLHLFADKKIGPAILKRIARLYPS